MEFTQSLSPRPQPPYTPPPSIPPSTEHLTLSTTTPQDLYPTSWQAVASFGRDNASHTAETDEIDDRWKSWLLSYGQDPTRSRAPPPRSAPPQQKIRDGRRLSAYGGIVASFAEPLAFSQLGTAGYRLDGIYSAGAGPKPAPQMPKTAKNSSPTPLKQNKRPGKITVERSFQPLFEFESKPKRRWPGLKHLTLPFSGSKMPVPPSHPKKSLWKSLFRVKVD